jgi:hypothetical protein
MVCHSKSNHRGHNDGCENTSIRRLFMKSHSKSGAVGQLTKSEQAKEYLKALFSKCTSGQIEIRQMVNGRIERQDWVSINELRMPQLASDADVFVGTAARCASSEGKEKLVEIPALWLDLNLKDINKAKVEEKLCSFPLAPSIVVCTEDGWHLCWVLKETAKCDQIGRVENLNKRLAQYFGGSQEGADPARFRRLPGTMNLLLNPPVQVNCEYLSTDQYSLDELERILPTLLERDQSAVNDINQRSMPEVDWEGYNRSIKTIDPNELLEIIEKTSYKMPDFLKCSIPKRSMIMSPWLKEGSLACIYSKRGVGKTWLGLSIALAVTGKVSIAGQWRAVTPASCLYVDGEMGADELRDRIRLLLPEDNGGEHQIWLWSRELTRAYGRIAPNLTDENWRRAIHMFLRKRPDIRVLILDNLSSLAPYRNENIKDTWDPIGQWQLSLRADRIAVIFMHHANKQGGQRGTSGLEDYLDVSIVLDQPENKVPTDKLRLNVRYMKTRSIYGKDAAPFSMMLTKCGYSMKWVIANSMKKSNEIVMLLSKRMKQKDIAEKLGCKPSYVCQTRKTAIENGWIDENNELTDRGKEIFKEKPSAEDIIDDDGSWDCDDN